MADVVRITTAAIIRRGDRLLIAKRKPGGSIGGKWEFPGGKARYGETPAGALERELREELGAHATVGRRLGTVEFDHSGEHYILHAYDVVVHNIDFTPMHEALRWVLPRELESYDLAGSDRTLAEALHFISGR